MIGFLWRCALLGLAALPVGAHQLTGTDVATLALLSVDHDRLTGTYEVQYGELAALEERRRMDVDGDGRLSVSEMAAYAEDRAADLSANLALDLDGQPLALNLVVGQVLPADSLVAPGQLTLRFELQVEPVQVVRERTLHLCDANALPRQVHADLAIETLPLVDIGQVTPRAGALKQARVQAPAAPVEAQVLLRPSAALWTFPTPAATPAAEAGGPPASPSNTDQLKSLLRSGELSAGLIAFALGLALLLGAVHALEPGHGKTIVAAYLIGSRGTIANAVYLGGVVTFTHTFSVLLLGALTLFASQYILPEEIFPWLSASSGLLIWGLGLWLFVRALTGRGHGHSHGPHGHHHGPVPHHGHPHPPGPEPLLRPLPAKGRLLVRGYEHFGAPRPLAPEAAPQPQATRGSLLTLGISGGMVPCPGALVILLLAVALHRIAFGLLLIVAFSLGLAAVLIAIGVLMVKARPLLEGFSGEGRLARRLPLISSVVIMVVGLAMAVRALMDAGILVIRRPGS